MKPFLIGWLLLVALPVMAEDYYDPSEIRMRTEEGTADTWQALPLSRVDPQQRLNLGPRALRLADLFELSTATSRLYVTGPAARMRPG